MKLGNNFTCVLSKSSKGSVNYDDLDKTRVKLFPNFTRHHLITHTNNNIIHLYGAVDTNYS